MLTGKAAKTAMLTTLAILLVLFFLSCFRISAYNLPPEEAIGGKTKALTIGIGFNLLENPSRAAGGETAPENTIVSYSGLPVSGSTVIVGLIAWQIAAYNYSMRRLLK
jgi:hypothetical protein